MALIQTRRCDVYGVKNNVSTFKLTLERNDCDENLFGVEPVMVREFEITCDLSRRGAKRLLHLIDKATKPPTRKPKKSASTATVSK
ncbi:hypothetical protein [Nitrospira sp. BLG_1]|uniref:hypothetical protein n=1 Tax=Nitrospira sp. BLG_1 TaxID=3395883 RepID=UPI0039BD1DB9